MQADESRGVSPSANSKIGAQSWNDGKLAREWTGSASVTSYVSTEEVIMSTSITL
jgi:hypothetical protein